MGARVQARLVYGDETWLKIRGRWHYGVVVVAGDTALPVLAALFPSRGQGAGRGVDRPRRRLQKGPQGRITDG
jgi:transposase-like protein